MAKTVIGLFENESAAQQAVERLESIGLDRGMVDVSRRNELKTNANNNRDESDENGFTRFFNSIFGSDSDDAKRYSRASNECSIVTVHAHSSEQAERAADILDECGAVDVDERASSYQSASTTGTPRNASTNATPGGPQGPNRENRDKRGETAIPRMEENLEVGKRTEERGGVRVRSRIVEKPVEEHVRLREEHINVERQPVNRAVTDSDRASLQDRNIELTERAEVPVVNKESRIVEEVRISKDVTERDETVRDTLKNTEIDVDKFDQDDRRNPKKRP